MSKIVVCTLSCDQKYPLVVHRVEESSGIRNDIRRSIVIRGGANVIDRRSFITPNKGITEISDEDAELLAQCAAFKAHESAGFVKIIGMREDENKAVEDLSGYDDSSQLLAEDFSKESDSVARIGGNLKIGGEEVKPSARTRNRKRK